MSQLLTKIQYDFTGGLYKRFGTYMSPPNCVSKLQNARVDKGGFRQIGGYSALNATAIGASSITSGFRAYIGTKKVTLVTAGTFMYYWTVGSTSFTSCISGLTPNSPWSFVTYNSYIYCQNGVDDYRKIDISSCTSSVPPSVSAITAVGSCPPANSAQLFVARERVWAVGNSLYPDRAYYCSKSSASGLEGIGLPEVWSGNKYLAFPRQSNNMVAVGGIDWKDQPCVLTDTTFTLVLGDNNTEFEQPLMDNSIGCAARRTIQAFGGGIIFLGKTGVYFFTGGKCRCISLGIQNYIDDINRTYISNAVAIADENCYYLSYTSTAAGGVINNRTLIFDTRIGDVVGEAIKGGWTGPHTIGAGCFIGYFGPGDNSELYFGDASATGLVHKFMDDTVKSFNGSAIDMDVETYDYDYKELVRPDIKKQLAKVVVIAEPETAGVISASYYNDNNSSDTAIGTIDLATVGKERGDMSGKTDSTRTIVMHPLTVPLSVSSTCYFNRLRFRSNGIGSICIVRSIIQTSWLIENPTLI